VGGTPINFQIAYGDDFLGLAWLVAYRSCRWSMYLARCLNLPGRSPGPTLSCALQHLLQRESLSFGHWKGLESAQAVTARDPCVSCKSQFHRGQLTVLTPDRQASRPWARRFRRLARNPAGQPSEFCWGRERAV